MWYHVRAEFESGCFLEQEFEAMGFSDAIQQMIDTIEASINDKITSIVVYPLKD